MSNSHCDSREPIVPYNTEQEYSPNQIHGRCFRGLTKREFFASQCLSAFLARVQLSNPPDSFNIQMAAKSAVECADVLIYSLNKETPQ